MNRFVGVVAFTILFGFSQTMASETDAAIGEAAAENGLAKRSQEGPAALTSAVEIDGPWYQFGFTSAGVPATGCSPADPGGAPCTLGGSNTVFAGAPPWTFTVPQNGALLQITDAFAPGDTFEIFDHATSIETTLFFGGSPTCTEDPDVCYLDPAMSSDALPLPPGSYSITITLTASPNGAGAAFFRIVSHCQSVFCDGFESGDTTSWTTSP